MNSPHADVVQETLARVGRLLQQRQPEKAERVCRELLERAPEALDGHYMLAVTLAAQGAHISAVAACDVALVLSADHVRSRLQKAQSLMALGRRAEAVAEVERAAQVGPTDAFSLNAIAVTLTRAGLHERAVTFYQSAMEAGGAPAHWYNLASGLHTIGRFEEARAAYRACLKLEPRHSAAWSGLVEITTQTKEANEVRSLEVAFAAARGHPAATQDLGHALAKAWEDMGEPLKAMNWLERAKAGMRKASDHSPGKDVALFQAAERAAGAADTSGAPGPVPIFVVGLPRTGTTLVERILTSHSGVSAAGELPDFPEAVRAVGQLSGAENFSAAIVEASGRADAGEVGRAYAAAVRERLALTGRFVDKLPVNFFLAPAILRALPDARVICVRRHPADAMLANYRQVFAREARYLDYALDLECAAHYVAQFETLAADWAKRLPADRYHEVRYEDVVGDIEGEVRQLLDVCGLGFEPACVDFHQNTSPVATASAAQVRQPLYATSIGKWRRYRPAIDAGLQILVDRGAMAASELTSGAGG